MKFINNLNKYFNKLIGIKHKFNNPSDIAIASDGSLFITDTNNHVICKVTVSGDIEVYAGKVGVFGHNNGDRLDATFNRPVGITIDKDDNLLIADSGNNIIRSIKPDGTVTTVAGKVGVRGVLDGNGTNALLYNPCGITISKDNVIYISDTGSSTIRKIDKNLDVTTIAGMYMNNRSVHLDGFGTEARFSNPRGLKMDENDNLYIADTHNNCVRLMTPDGNVTTVANDTKLYGPHGITIHNNIVYVTDTYNKLIKLIHKNGNIDTIPNTNLKFPYGIIMNNNKLIIVDRKQGIIHIE
jgi:sugar lactone lactonase YvrE